MPEIIQPITTVGTDYSTVTATSQQLTGMAPGYQYYLRSSTACYYKVGPAGVVASAADGSIWLGANAVVPVCAKGPNDTVAIIREAADGVATLFRTENGDAVVSL